MDCVRGLLSHNCRKGETLVYSYFSRLLLIVELAIAVASRTPGDSDIMHGMICKNELICMVNKLLIN